MESNLTVRIDDLTGPEIQALLQEHLHQMHAQSPPESVHALDLTAVRRTNITFWTVWKDSDLLGCGALRELNRFEGEVKSMRTAEAHRRRGAAAAVLHTIVGEARRRGYRRINLETGSYPPFEPARALYTRFGFKPCGPFGDYAEDPNSVFMTLDLTLP